MSTHITTPYGSTTPTTWLEFESSRDARTIVHALADGDVNVVHNPASTRSIKLALFYTDEARSAQAEQLLAAGGISTIVEEARPTASMSFVVTGRITRTLDTQFNVWVVAAECREVPA